MSERPPTSGAERQLRNEEHVWSRGAPVAVQAQVGATEGGAETPEKIPPPPTHPSPPYPLLHALLEIHGFLLLPFNIVFKKILIIV